MISKKIKITQSQRHLRSVSREDFGERGKPSLDYIVIDYKYFDEISIVIGQQPNYLKNQIDQFIIQNFNQYTNQLIKLNY